MLYKKRTCPPSVKMGTVLSRYVVNHHSSWPRSFICDNENVFMKGISTSLSGGINVALVKVRNNEQGCNIFNYKHVCPCTKGNKHIKCILGTLLYEWCHSNRICSEKCNATVSYLYRENKSRRQSALATKRAPRYLVVLLTTMGRELLHHFKREYPRQFNHSPEPTSCSWLLFINRRLSLVDHPLKEDPTIQYLYTSAIFQQQLKNANKDDPLCFMDFQIMEYDNFLSLASSFDQPALQEALNNAKARTETMKSKYEQLFSSDVAANQQASTSSFSSTTPAMEFVSEFKRKREEEVESMNWNDCWEEGEEANTQHYKNPESLRQQFSKYTKKHKKSDK